VETQGLPGKGCGITEEYYNTLDIVLENFYRIAFSFRFFIPLIDTNFKPVARYGYNLIFVCIDNQLSQYHLLKILSFSINLI
jgi:hypothetical protein